MPEVIAYLSMEIGLESTIPTYSGGLGVLAGDSLRSAADLALPVVGVSLVHRQGYFRQGIDASGMQTEAPDPWPVETRLQPISERTTVLMEGREVHIRAWRYDVRGAGGHIVPVYLLDTDLPENMAEDRRLTDNLYGGGRLHRLRQEVVLGLGGLKFLRVLGHHNVAKFHLNEGHAALVVLGLLEERLSGNRAFPPPEVLEWVRKRCVFTTHTPVSAGHDEFLPELVQQVLGQRRHELLAHVLGSSSLHMTHLGLRGSSFVNGVAMRHWQVSKTMFPEYPIESITNGVHAGTWAAPSMQALFDQRLPNWRRDSLMLRYALELPEDELWAAHRQAKQDLFARVEQDTGVTFDVDVLTLGFARRSTAYKRADLLFSDLDRLRDIARHRGALQLVYGGKAHPRDQEGKQIIARIHEAGRRLGDLVRAVYLPNYDMDAGRLITSGTDVWLNNPHPPLEASGTSGMKAAINGVPSLSVLDGWWIEGHAEGVTGWSIGEPYRVGQERHDSLDATALYDKLETAVMPRYYDAHPRFLDMMRRAIAFNGSFFNTQRMMIQYARNAYGLSWA